jgi:uncharacterized protein (TIGR03000 family)
MFLRKQKVRSWAGWFVVVFVVGGWFVDSASAKHPLLDPAKHPLLKQLKPSELAKKMAEKKAEKGILPRRNDCATGSVAGGGGGMVFGEMQGFSDGTPYQVVEPNAAYLTINVPEVNLDNTDAVVTINGDPTASVGPARRFIIRDMEIDKEYDFQIIAVTANRAGVERMEVKKITLRSGDMQSVSMHPKRRRSDVEQELAESQSDSSSQASGSPEVVPSLPAN